MAHPSHGIGSIPDKIYFKIGEVSDIVGVDPHVLRYWESEFGVIKPHRASSKQRLYRRSDVENIIRIKELLYDQGFTIAGARKALRQEKKDPGVEEICPPAIDKGVFEDLKKELLDIKKLLER
ncbi:MAG: MerR family transcriptional regulator [Proteobacteria bacterium]|nr:MerR family transcriptional regulator [Pseudomonadota bacterium]MBU1738150.1 MerR family transcriptional regulator [Pseudomonadota bacterium]